MVITFISDTHGTYPEIPECDLVIHSGDATTYKNPYYNLNLFLDCLTWLDSLPMPAIYIPGNHDTSLEFGLVDQEFKTPILIHEEYEFNGFKIFGSPYTPEFHNWAYNKTADELKILWEDIPQDTDIVVTHGPPYGILDQTYEYGEKINVGCKHLLDKIKEIQPLVHVFGHIHDERDIKNYGIIEEDTKYLNASLTDLYYNLKNKPICLKVSKTSKED